MLFALGAVTMVAGLVATHAVLMLAATAHIPTDIQPDYPERI